jgi:hypothetical protein
MSDRHTEQVTIVAMTHFQRGPFTFGWLSYDPQVGGQVIPW